MSRCIRFMFSSVPHLVHKADIGPEFTALISHGLLLPESPWTCLWGYTPNRSSISPVSWLRDLSPCHLFPGYPSPFLWQRFWSEDWSATSQKQPGNDNCPPPYPQLSFSFEPYSAPALPKLWLLSMGCIIFIFIFLSWVWSFDKIQPNEKRNLQKLSSTQGMMLSRDWDLCMLSNHMGYQGYIIQQQIHRHNA